MKSTRVITAMDLSVKHLDNMNAQRRKALLVKHPHRKVITVINGKTTHLPEGERSITNDLRIEEIVFELNGEQRALRVKACERQTFKSKADQGYSEVFHCSKPGCFGMVITDTGVFPVQYDLSGAYNRYTGQLNVLAAMTNSSPLKIAAIHLSCKE